MNRTEKSLLVVAVFHMAVLALIIALFTGSESTYVTRVVTKTVRDTGIADQVEKVRGAVVHIYKKGVCQGSGCLLSADGVLFTAKHVTDGVHGDYEVRTDDGRILPVKYAIEDKDNDVAFMLLDLEHARKPGPQWAPADGLDTKNYVEYMQKPDLPYAVLASEDSLRAGDRVFIMGSPLGIYNFNSVSLGIVAARGRDLYNRSGWESCQRYDWRVMLQSTSPAFPGNSGGPVFDLDCNVVGVLVAGEAETLNFSVPVSRFSGTIDTVRMWLSLCRFNVVKEDEQETFNVAYEMQQLANAIDELK